MDCDCESVSSLSFKQDCYRSVLDTVSRFLILNYIENDFTGEDDFYQIPEPFSVENVVAIVILEQLKEIPKPFKTLKRFYEQPELLEEFIDYEKVTKMMADLFEEKTEIMEKIVKNENGENKKGKEIQSISRAQALEELLSKLRKLI